MWITRKEYDGLVKGLLLMQGRAEKAELNFEWMRVRVNQLERERAVLLQRALEVPIEAPELLRDDPRPLPPQEIVRANGLPNLAGIDFEDIGDELAQSHGILHDEEGRIRYRG